MKTALHILLILGLLAGSIALFLHEQTASPRPLIADHARKARCNECHTAWRGVASESCLKCHHFKDYYALRPAIRFHTAGRFCMACHTEHLGTQGEISRMDHTLLNADLLCSDCHLAPHQGLFGQACRECHGLSSWRVDGYEHPPIENRNCHLCHRPPVSHTDEAVWERLLSRHAGITGVRDIQMNQCWKCHLIHSWRHLRM